MISLILTSIVPASVMAEQTEIPVEAVLQTGNNNGNSQEEAFVFENGQVILVTNTKEDLLKNAVLNSELQTDAMDSTYEVADIDGGVKITKYTGSGGDVVVPATLDGRQYWKLAREHLVIIIV